MTDALVVFTPSGKRGRFPLGTPVLQAARQLGVDIDTVCGGRAICGRCQVTRGRGELRQARDHQHRRASERVRRDRGALPGRKGMAPGRRLSCQALLLGDLVIDVPADSQVHRQVVRKRPRCARSSSIPLDRLHYVEVEEPDMHRQRGDLERVQEALAGAVGAGRARDRPRAAARAAEEPAARRLEGDRRRARRASGSSPPGRASTTASTASRSTSARPRSRRICAISAPARSWPPRA